MKTTLLFLSVFLSANLFGQTFGNGVTDIDGNFYESVIIGNQEWMAENLKVTHYSNGDEIAYTYTDCSVDSLWLESDFGMWTEYASQPLNYDIGKHYNGYVISDERNVCPQGWTVPNFNDWETLVNFLDTSSFPNTAGSQMKVTGGYWPSPDNSTNESGFSSYPSGAIDYLGQCVHILDQANYWTNTIHPDFPIETYFGITLHNGPDAQIYGYVSSLNYGLSIRCIKTVSNDLNELPPSSKNLIQILDMMGRETTFKPNTPLIYVYDDGSIEKVFRVEY